MVDEMDTKNENGAHLNVVPDFVAVDDYPNISNIALSHLQMARRYAERAHEAFRLSDDDTECHLKETQFLREEYLCLLNYSATRVYCNTAAMMMPITYQEWGSTNFSDDTRMITHAVMNGHYRSLYTGDQRDHITIPHILNWCRSLGINTSERVLRLIINNGLADGMFTEVNAFRGNTKGIGPSTRCQDMYQASCALYATFFSMRWVDLEMGCEKENVSDALTRLIELNPEGGFQDVSIISRGMVRHFKSEGVDLMAINKPLPRFTK